MDPQCDATRFLLHDKLEKDFDGDYSAMISRAHCTGGIGGDRCRTLYEAMAPLLLTHDHPQYVIEPYEIQTPAGAKVTGKIFLIAGHEETVELEQKMATAEESWQSPALAALSKPHDVFKETAVRHGCSFILIDTNPFSGTLNCNLWHSSDYFLIPCGADNASMHGIRALTDLILKPGPGWLNRQRSNLHNFATRQAFLATQGAHISPFPDKVRHFICCLTGLDWTGPLPSCLFTALH